MAPFTKNKAPVTGLTLAQIDLYLKSINKSTGVVTNIWNPQNPSTEIGGDGRYFKIYASADFEINDYVARFVFTGTATLVDSIYGFSQCSDNPADSAIALLDYTDGIETGLTARGALRLIAAACAGVLSGAATLNVLIRNAVADNKTRINATVDSNGNRSAITTDTT